MLNFFDPVARYGAQETLTAIKALTFESLTQSLTESLKGQTRKELYDTIPESLAQWNESMDRPDAAFNTLKVIAISAVIAAFILPVPLAILGITGGNFGLAIVGGSEFAVLMTGAIVVYFVANHFQHKFMNRNDLSDKEIADTKNKIKRDLQKRIHRDVEIIYDRLAARKEEDLTTCSQQLQNQFESMYLLGKFIEDPVPFKKEGRFYKFLEAKNYTNL